MAPTRIDHDSIFKQILSEFFVEFLDLFAPDALALLDPSSLTFLDKESFVDLLDPDRREADLVVQVRLRGRPASFIIHLEHQAQRDRTLDRRMFRYFSRFYDRYNTPIYPIALCSYAAPIRQARDRHLVALGSLDILTFQYRVVQLNQLHWRTYLRHPNPLATALLARMAVPRTDRVRAKLEAISVLAGLPLPPRRRTMLAAFIDTYLALNPTEQVAFQQELALLHPHEKESVMELVTHWHREGRVEGRVEGLRAGITALLRVRFAPNVGALADEIATISDPTLLEAILNRLTTATSLDEVRALYESPPS